jgi:hypothetical protein
MEALEDMVSRLKEDFDPPQVAQAIAGRLSGMKTAKSLRFHDLVASRSFEAGLHLLLDELALELKVRVIAT